MIYLLSYCGLTDASVRASEKDLPVNHLKVKISNTKCPKISVLYYFYFLPGSLSEGGSLIQASKSNPSGMGTFF